MSNEFDLSTRTSVPVRWRMNLPAEIFDSIMEIATVEDRDPGAVAARWLREHHKNLRAAKTEGTDA